MAIPSHMGPLFHSHVVSQTPESGRWYLAEQYFQHLPCLSEVLAQFEIVLSSLPLFPLRFRDIRGSITSSWDGTVLDEDILLHLAVCSGTDSKLDPEMRGLLSDGGWRLTFI